MGQIISAVQYYAHYYLDEHTATAILSEVENAISHGADLEIMRYREVA